MGFFKFAALRKTESDRRLFKSGRQDRASPRSLWVRQESGLDVRGSREHAAAPDVVIMDRKRCQWVKRVSTVNATNRWEGACMGESSKYPARVEEQLPVNSTTISSSSSGSNTIYGIIYMCQELCCFCII